MTAAPTVAILAHLYQGFDEEYFLASIANHHWRPRGIEVRLQQGCSDPVDAAIAFLHVDLTRTPAAYLDLAGHYPVAVNGRVEDISKRRISRQLLGEHDDWDGPVIVKTDLNHGGTGERRLRRSMQRGMRRRLGEFYDRHLTRSLEGSVAYRVYERREQVPRKVWRRRDLVVERFFVQRERGLYAMNQWYFLGEAEIVSTMMAPTPVVAMDLVTDRLPLHREVPHELRGRRAELGFDYGKFDYVMHEGEARLIDANKTPHLAGDTPSDERIYEICGTLATGLESLLS